MCGAYIKVKAALGNNILAEWDSNCATGIINGIECTKDFVNELLTDLILKTQGRPSGKILKDLNPDSFQNDNGEMSSANVNGGDMQDHDKDSVTEIIKEIVYSKEEHIRTKNHKRKNIDKKGTKRIKN